MIWKAIAIAAIWGMITPMLFAVNNNPVFSSEWKEFLVDSIMCGAIILIGMFATVAVVMA